MDCDGLKKAFIYDKDGTLMPDGQRGTVFAYSEFAWDAMDRDRARGTGDYRIPRTMLTDSDGTRIDIDSFATFVGRGQHFRHRSQADASVNTVLNCSNTSHHVSQWFQASRVIATLACVSWCRSTTRTAARVRRRTSTTC